MPSAPSLPTHEHYALLNTIAQTLLNDYGYCWHTPVPIEAVLQHPRPGMWEIVNIAEVSLGYYNSREPYAPRMSLARLLARHVLRSQWASCWAVAELTHSAAHVAMLARLIVVPTLQLGDIYPENRTPLLLRQRFEMPLREAEVRLDEFDQFAGG